MTDSFLFFHFFVTFIRQAEVKPQSHGCDNEHFGLLSEVKTYSEAILQERMPVPVLLLVLSIL